MQLRLVIPHAVWPRDSEAAEVCVGLALPALARLCGRGRRTPLARQGAPEWLGRAFGLADFPAGPLTVLAECPDSAAGYWLRADPVHLQINTQGACMADPRGLAVTADEAAQLINTLNHQFAGDDLHFVAAAPDRWLLRLHEAPQVSFAPLEAVFGNEIGAFLPHGPDAGRWHRRLNEMQMLLYSHPVNDVRAGLGQPLINSLWLWGGGSYPLRCALQQPDRWILVDDPMLAALARLAGCQCAPRPPVLQSLPGTDVLVVLDELVSPALWGDALTWREGWQMLEGDWLAPACRWLSAGKISTLELILPEAGLTVSVSRSDLWCLWRRGWLPW